MVINACQNVLIMRRFDLRTIAPEYFVSLNKKIYLCIKTKRFWGFSLESFLLKYFIGMQYDFGNSELFEHTGEDRRDDSP